MNSPIKLCLGMEENNMHLFQSRCCKTPISLEDFCSICCGYCGKVLKGSYELIPNNEKQIAKWENTE